MAIALEIFVGYLRAEFFAGAFCVFGALAAAGAIPARAF